MKILILLLSISYSWGASSFKTYHIGNLMVIFHKIDGNWVNKSCVDNDCQALAMGKKYRESNVPVELLRGGKNPFAVRCKTVMKGNVLIAVDKKGNEQSLCHFPDDSFLF